jgi:hypothetical protein
METVEGLLKGLRLSEVERSGVRIGRKEVESGGGKKFQAIGKLLADKPAIPEAMENALGPLWCPLQGLDCTDLGDNKFLFTFHQEGGRKKAVENGPWTFDKGLLVMEEFVADKTLDEYEFTTIPIWVRVFKLPLGMMTRRTAEDIGDRVGEFLEVDGVVDGMAVGKFLRVKVRMNISVPLMRGTMVVVDDKGSSKWCPFEYEYLPDFCFTCGIIGHLDRGCSIKLKRGEEAQFGKWLRWLPPRRQGVGERKNWSENWGKQTGAGGNGGGRLGSDARWWRKDDPTLKDRERSSADGKEKESSNTQKKQMEKEDTLSGTVKEQLLLEDTGLGGGQKRVAVLGTVLERGGADEQVMFKPMEVLGDGSVKGVSGVGAKVSGEEKKDFQNGETVDKPKRGKFRRVERIGTGNGAGESKTEFCKKGERWRWR